MKLYSVQSVGFRVPVRHYLWCLLGAGVLFLSACREQPSDTRQGRHSPAADTFTVAFYNVENLFDNEFDGHEYLEYRPNATNWNSEMHRKKFENIGTAGAAIHAEVLALCEVEDRDALTQLQQSLKDAGVRYPYRAIIDTPAAATTCPALLAMFPVTAYRLLPVTLPAPGSTRGILEADLDIHGRALKLFVNHWPSKHHPESYRVAAAARLVDRLKELPAGTDYLVLGDFNSDYDEFSTFTTFGLNDTRGETGLGHRLGTIRVLPGGAIRPAGEKEAAAGTFPSHYDLWLELPASIRMSYFYKGNLQTPDHIVLPPSLYDSTGIAYVDNSFSAFTWGGRLLSYGKPVRWKQRYSGGKKYHVGEGYSDHLPVTARFTTSPFTVDSADSAGDDVLPVITPAAAEGWFEFHNNGWVAGDNGVRIARDTFRAASGRYALHIVAPALRKTCVAARAVLDPAVKDAGGAIRLFIRGSGTVCMRTRTAGEEKWRYHSLANGKVSLSARYSPVLYPEWKTVVLKMSAAGSGAIEIELRTRKDSPLDFWIDR